ncbi:MAG: hypothetical protein H7Y13_03095 [Sphingobacteriaceae bacterium]|nr:hypothetical protein [Sphingobacteriaceae bacterium]
MYSFDTRTSEDKLKELLNQYEDFKQNNTSSAKAAELSTNAWHLTDWVFEEFKVVHLMLTLGDFRETLYPECPSLKIMHDIANGSKHSKVSRPKALIKETKRRIGPFSSVFSRAFSQTTLQIEMADGCILYFLDEIENVISFWKSYFESQLKIKVRE